jgi:ligand-binding sensor domain-containing protein
MKKLITLILITILFINGLLAQDTILFGNLLYGGTAKSIVIGPATNLLIPPWGGLIEYDPLTDSVINWYKRSNSILYSSFISDYAYDADSSLWHTSYYKNFVYKFDETDYQFYNYENSPLPEKAQRFFIEFNQSNELWVGTADSGLYIRHIDSSWTRYPPGEENILRGNEILNLYKDDDGIFYIGTDIGITIFDNGTWKYIELYESIGYYHSIHQIFKSSYDSLYVITNNYCYIQKSINHHKIKPDDFDSIGDSFYGIAENNSGDIFISSSDGFIIIPPIGVTRVYNKWTTPGGENIKYLGKVFYDKYRDHLFFNNNDKMITFKDEAFQTPFCIGCDDLPSWYVGAAFFDKDNRLWISSINYLYVKEDNNWTTYTSNFSGSAIRFVQTPSGELLYGSTNYVWVFNDSIWKKTIVIPWPENGIYDIAAGKDNYTYATTRDGVYKKRVDEGWLNIGVFDISIAITCDRDGLIWFTMENKIGSYDGENITYYSIFNSDLPPSNPYHNICADSIGRLWLETDSTLYINENNEWKCIIPGFKNGLINVYVDNYYNTWVLSHKNLYFMNQTDTIVYNYENAPFVSSYFSGGTPGPDNNFYINSYGGITTVKYTVLEDIEEKPYTQRETETWLKVFPNPTEGFITFEVLGEGLFTKQGRSTVEIKNLLGQSIACFGFEGNTIRWDTKSLKPGIYVYQIKKGSRKSSGKIVIR